MKKSYVVFYVFVLLVSVLSALFLNKSFFVETPVVDDGYEIIGFNVDMTVNHDNTIYVKEDIRVVFHEEFRHGIYRSLPKINNVTYAKNDKIVNRNYKVDYDSITANVLADYYSDSDYIVLKLGDENKTVETNRNYTYTIEYNISLGDDRDVDFDFFYFNIIGSGWDTTIKNASFDITFEKPVQNQNLKLYVRDDEIHTLNLTDNGTKINYTYPGILQPFEAMTVAIEMEQGYFNVIKTSSKALSYDVVMLVIVLLILLISFIIKKANSNPKDLVSIVEFHIPDDLNSSEAGYLIDGELSDHDIVSLIVYWANQGYLAIKEENKKFYLTKLKDMYWKDKNYNQYEKKLFDKIFAKSSKDVEIDHIGSECYTEIQNAILNIKTKHDANSFSQRAKSGRNVSAVLMAVGAFLVSNFVNSYIFMKNGLIFNVAFAVLIYFSLKTLISIKDNEFKLGFVGRKSKYIVWLIMSVVLITFYEITCFDLYVDTLGAKIFVAIIYYVVAYLIYTTNIRTSSGMDKLGSLVGLREYIEKAEKPQLEYLVEENPSAYYDILPFAYVLGVSDIWINKFEDIKISNPSWLSSDMDEALFTNYYYSKILLSSLNTTQRSISAFRTNKAISDFTKNISSGGSGSSGGFGGFSGGGFGGGGGGSW